MKIILIVSNDILKLQGSILTNKYAEGYPNKRYYGGCEYIDMFEDKAIEYLKELFLPFMYLGNDKPIEECLLPIPGTII